MNETPTMYHLMGAYFHQDCMDDAADEWEVLKQFLDDQPEMAHILADEIDWTLEHFRSEAEVKSYVLNTLGSEFLADWNGGTFRGWLTEIARRVRG